MEFRQPVNWLNHYFHSSHGDAGEGGEEVVTVLWMCLTCMMSDEVTIGLIPSSIRVPEERERTMDIISLSLSLCSLILTSI